MYDLARPVLTSAVSASDKQPSVLSLLFQASSLPLQNKRLPDTPPWPASPFSGGPLP